MLLLGRESGRTPILAARFAVRASGEQSKKRGRRQEDDLLRGCVQYIHAFGGLHLPMSIMKHVHRGASKDGCHATSAACGRWTGASNTEHTHTPVCDVLKF